MKCLHASEAIHEGGEIRVGALSSISPAALGGSRGPVILPTNAPTGSTLVAAPAILERQLRLAKTT